MDKCQIWYKGTSKHFVESICLIETAKTEVFFTSWKESSPKWSKHFWSFGAIFT